MPLWINTFMVCLALLMTLQQKCKNWFVQHLFS
ncbi:hypothetical protein Goshw_012356 [Gossypium schwendimanii]|uniref:Uncharacterized protein n=1 Tax=Gossypium schwendimanii TaxID=34291 RepID=A0A7J9N310_GOSSC|nr:hypothetical protein [Gossypium schwendimanii]